MLKVSQGRAFLELILVSSFSSTSSGLTFLVLQSVWPCPEDPRWTLEPSVDMWTNGGCFTTPTFTHTHTQLSGLLLVQKELSETH